MNKARLISIIVLAVMLACVTVASCSYSFHNEHPVTLTVRKAERVQSAKSGQYLVFTDQDVYCVSDSIWRFTFDASDRYGKLEVGKTYEATVVGWRNRFFSHYPNLLVIQETEE